ncbi:DUF305 domain-containing protein [Micromonospora peucetia]|uniref:DUF305 domain-containing protein n=1 Tax=Micromonospora peucetia TaxID=47871 RepID=A0A1C6VFL4_9ACTN|nr:DUF305 domain-containing protein [Micromonospora peucetia]WSA30231.1 DUF305 domain-containing protein [Micromonospora peucetia]SCL65085.1 Uncharacterized conserved protein, DUF305 family [Micromonospora peucetia]
MSIPTAIETSEPASPAPEERRPSARRWGTAALALAVVVGLLLGYAGGMLTPRLTRPGDASAEAGFARDMMTHHAQAVEMGLIAFDEGADPAVRSIGGDIATAQQGEIGTMHTWLRLWGLDPSGSEPSMSWMSDGAGLVKNGLMPGMATPEEMAKLHAAEGRELDVLFLQLMIKHHLGGIHMIDGILDVSDEPDVVKTAQTMKNTQQNDLTNLQHALERLGG